MKLAAAEGLENGGTRAPFSIVPDVEIPGMLSILATHDVNGYVPGISPPHPRALALSALLHALNLHWSSISHMVIYMFQCYPLKTSHPCLLPHSPKVCSLHLCLFCCLAYKVYRLSKFHIYALIYCIGVFLSDLLHTV